MPLGFDFNISANPDQAEKAIRKVERSLERLEGVSSQLQRTFLRLFSAISTGFIISKVVSASDEFINLNNRLRTVIGTENELIVVRRRLLEISNDTRTSFATNAEVYQRFTAASKELGTSQQDLLTFTRALNNAVQLSGTTAIEAANGIRQLSQGFGSGTLRGDELRAVLEQMPVLADVIAKRMGVTRFAIKKLGEEGKLTGRIITEALLQAAPELEARFKRLTPTISQQLQVLKNQFLIFIGDLNESTGAAVTLGNAIRLVADNLKTLLTILKDAAFVAIVGKLIGMAKAAQIAAPAIGGVNSALLLGASQFYPEYAKGATGAAVATGGFGSKLGGLWRGLQSGLPLFAIATAGVSSFEKTLDFLKDEGFLEQFFLTFVDGLEGVTSQSKAARDELESLAQDAIRFSSIGSVIVSSQREILAIQKRATQQNRELSAGERDRVNQLQAQIEKQAAAAKEEQRVAAERIKVTDKETVSIKNLIDRLNEEAEALKLSNREQEIQKRIRQEIEKLNRKGIFPLPEQRQEIENRIRLVQGLQEESDVREGILGPIAKMKTDMGNLAFLLRQETISVEQFNAAMAGLLGIKLPPIEGFFDFQQLSVSLNFIQRAFQKLPEGPREFAQAFELVDKAMGELVAAAVEGLPTMAAKIEQVNVLLAQNRINATAARAAIDQLLGPSENEQLIRQVEELNLQLLYGKVTIDQYNTALANLTLRGLETSKSLEDGFSRAFVKMREEATNLAAVGESVVNVFADNLTNALVTLAETGQLSFKELARSIVADLTKIIARLLVVQALSAIFGAPVAPPGTVPAGELPFSFAGGRQAGGPVQAGRSYLVGEGGQPELFTPRRSGTVTPMSELTSAPPQVNVQVVNVDDPNQVPAAINKGGADQAILNVLARNRSKVKQTIGG